MEHIRVATATATTTTTATTTRTITDTDYASAVYDVYADVYDDHPETEAEMTLARQLGFLTTALLLVGRRLCDLDPRKQGRCLDHLQPGVSHMAHAGRRAFAVRTLPKGSIIVPVPLMVVITDQSTMDVYHRNRQPRHSKEDGGQQQQQQQTTIPYTTQLLVNYCFGHSRSTLLLCPASTTNLIHHYKEYQAPSPSHNDDHQQQQPNAKLRWATSFDPDTSVRLASSHSDGMRAENSTGTAWFVLRS